MAVRDAACKGACNTCLGSRLNVAVGYFFSSVLETVRLSPPCLIATTVSCRQLKLCCIIKRRTEHLLYGDLMHTVKAFALEIPQGSVTGGAD